MQQVLNVQVGEGLRGVRADNIKLEARDVLQALRNHPNEFQQWLVQLMPNYRGHHDPIHKP